MLTGAKIKILEETFASAQCEGVAILIKVLVQYEMHGIMPSAISFTAPDELHPMLAPDFMLGSENGPNTIWDDLTAWSKRLYLMDDDGRARMNRTFKQVSLKMAEELIRHVRSVTNDAPSQAIFN